MVPTYKQIEPIAYSLVSALGSGVHLRASDLVISVDATFPGMSDSQFQLIRAMCVEIVDDIRHDALSMMWDSRE